MRRPVSVLLATSACLMAVAGAAVAAEAPTRRQVAEAVAARVQSDYVFADKAAAAARLVRQRTVSGAYDKATDDKAFVDAVTADLFAATQDKHLVVRWRAQGFPPSVEALADAPGAHAAALREMKRANFQMPRAEVLPGNVGYLRIAGFEGPEDAGPALAAAMAFLANTDALIFDLRDNGGGDSATVALAISYLVPGQTKLVAFRNRAGTEAQSWTVPFVAGGRWSTTNPVYVLTSGKTFSAAEEFAYDLQQLKRGTVVGARTLGGANPGVLHLIGQHYGMFVPNEAAVGPVSGGNWEGVGVAPDVSVEPAQALATAHRLALKALLAKADAAEKPDLEEALNKLDG